LPDPFPHYHFIYQNDLQIAFYFETFYVGLGQTSAVRYADTLAYQQRVDQLSTWGIESFNILTMWGENPGDALMPSFGGWYYAKSTMYLGVKRNDKFGWIEVDNTDNFHPRFIRYAIVK